MLTDASQPPEKRSHRVTGGEGAALLGQDEEGRWVWGPGYFKTNDVSVEGKTTAAPSEIAFVATDYAVHNNVLIYECDSGIAFVNLETDRQALMEFEVENTRPVTKGFRIQDGWILAYMDGYLYRIDLNDFIAEWEQTADAP